MRELMRELLSANLFVTGIILTLASFVVFYGSIYLLNFTNLGRKLAFLVTGAGIFAWSAIGSLLFVMYAPRGPKPEDIEGLNAWEIRVIPMTFLLVSVILLVMFMVALSQYERTQEEV